MGGVTVPDGLILARRVWRATRSRSARPRHVRDGALTFEIDRGPVGRRSGDEIYGPPNRIAVLVRRERLEDFNAIDQARGNDIELDVADVAFRRGNIDSVDSDVAQTRLG